MNKAKIILNNLTGYKPFLAYQPLRAFVLYAFYRQGKRVVATRWYAGDRYFLLEHVDPAGWQSGLVYFRWFNENGRAVSKMYSPRDAAERSFGVWLPEENYATQS